MNRVMLPLRFASILFLLILSAPTGAWAQALSIDSLSLDSLESLPFDFLPIEACGFFLTPPGQDFVLIQDSATLADLVEPKRFIGQCKDLVIPQIDFSHYAVVGFNVFVDCNAMTDVRLFRDTTMPGYRIVVDDYYGGCRGMTSRSYWLLIPPLAQGDSVRIEEHHREYRWEERNGDR